MNTPTLLISDDNRSRSGSLVEAVRGRVCQLDSANEYLTLLNPSGLLLHSSPFLSSPPLPPAALEALPIPSQNP